MMGAIYKTKKDLKAAVGHTLDYVETSLFGPEYRATGMFTVVGPSPIKRVWYATVTMQDDLIVSVK